VVAAPDPLRGFVPKAFVVLRPGFRGTDELVKELQDHVKKELAPYKYPRQIAFVPALPHTETGKLRRVELRQQEAGRAVPP
jgi:acetyl-CoA synthetase